MTNRWVVLVLASATLAGLLLSEIRTLRTRMDQQLDGVREQLEAIAAAPCRCEQIVLPVQPAPGAGEFWVWPDDYY